MRQGDKNDWRNKTVHKRWFGEGDVGVDVAEEWAGRPERSGERYSVERFSLAVGAMAARGANVDGHGSAVGQFRRCTKGNLVRAYGSN